MPLGAFRLNTLAKTSAVVAVFTEAIRTPVPAEAYGSGALSTTQSKFGNTSWNTPGNSSDCEMKDFDLINKIDEGDFTFECWVYLTEANSKINHMFGSAQTSSGGNGWTLRQRGDASTTSDKRWQFTHYGYGITLNSTGVYYGTGINNNQWYHVAVVREGSSISMYVDGTRLQTTTQAINSVADAATYHGGIGANGYYSSWGPTAPANGNMFISEYRFSTTARYTGTTYTIPTSKFTHDSDTIALFHMDGTDGLTTIVDDTGDRARLGADADGATDVERTGNAKFSASAIRLGANGDIIKPSRTDLGDIMDDGDYTIEAWVRHDSVGSVDYIFSNRKTTFGVFGWVLSMRGDVAGDPFELLTSGYTGITGSTSIQHQNGASINTWYHVALVRSSNILTMYVDGVASTTTIDLSGSSYALSDQLWFGSNGATSTQMLGYMDEIRISDTARYTSGFTPPTERFISDENTLLLIHGLGTDGSQLLLDDNSSARAPLSVAAIGNASINDTESKFGDTSIYCDGTGDYVFAREATGRLDFGTDDFTIEWFQYLPTLTNNYNAVDLRNGSNGSKILLYSNPTNSWKLYVNTAVRIDSGSVLSANTWQHICVCRESGNTRLYVDGTQRGSTYADSTNYQHDSIYIFYNSLSSAYDAQGYINEFRISDVARYSGASLTVPTEKFKNDANTRLLIHGEGRDGQTDILDDNSALLQ